MKYIKRERILFILPEFSCFISIFSVHVKVGYPIISEKGRPCRIENPWGERKCIVLRENGEKETFKTAYFEFSTQENEKIKLLKH